MAQRVPADIVKVGPVPDPDEFLPGRLPKQVFPRFLWSEAELALICDQWLQDGLKFIVHRDDPELPGFRDPDRYFASFNVDIPPGQSVKFGKAHTGVDGRCDLWKDVFFLSSLQDVLDFLFTEEAGKAFVLLEFRHFAQRIFGQIIDPDSPVDERDHIRHNEAFCGRSDFVGRGPVVDVF